MRLGSDAQFARVRDYLRACAFDEANVCRALRIAGIAEALPLTERDLDGVERRLATSIRLFLLLEEVTQADVDAAMDPETLAAAAQLGLLRMTGPAIRSEVLIAPVAGLLIASDRHRSTEGEKAANDAVYPGIADGTLRLLRVCSSATGTAALDIGAGSGVVALALAARGIHAVAADITARSTAFAEFNRRLNGLANAETVEGDLYAPVAGRTFDLIVAHPPYVPSLSGDKIFRDAGVSGEDLIRRIVAGLPEYLRPGGVFCAVTAGWDANDGPFENRARRWLEKDGSSFDLAFAESGGIAPEKLAEQLSGREGGAAASWQEAFAGRGLRRLSYGVLVIARREPDHEPALTVRGSFSAGTNAASLLEAMRRLRKERGQAKPSVLNPYDFVDYPCHALEQTHPDRLATLATLFGMRPAPFERCRVLELACGDGGNLMPMAVAAPGSRFLGIDLAGVPVKRANELAARLDLKNVEFRELDIMNLGADAGEFDYIIAHGVYSWVPDAVSDRILAICARHLAPQGVAYISYNTYPGCRIRELTRDMMRWQVRNVASPRGRIDGGLALIRGLVAAKPEGDLYRQILAKELEGLEEDADGSIYHDDLAPIMSPCFFHEFAARAAAKGLRYVAEADFHEMQEHIWPEPVQAALRGMGDRVEREQYLDFHKCRRFRQTLLCRDNVAISMPTPDRMRTMSFSSQARAVAPSPDLDGQKIEEFQGPRGSRVGVDLPVAKKALVHLASCWPQAVSFEDLLRSAGGNGDSAADLAQFLLAVHGAGLIETHRHPPRFVAQPGSKPRVSALARLQAAHGALLANQRHGMVRIEDARSRRLITLLDGTRDVAALAKELAAVAGETTAADQIARDLPSVLARLGRLALFA